MSRLRKDQAALDRASRAVERNPVPASQATIGAAREQLRAARGHLAESRSLLGRRQAAEKGWLALVTAGRAMLRSAGQDWMRTSRVGDRVIALEEARFKRADVGTTLKVLQGTLHGRGFYAGDDELSDAAYIGPALDLIERAIDRADEACRLLRRRS